MLFKLCQINLNVLCDPKNSNTTLIKAHSERELCALLIPFVIIKSCVIGLLQEDFHSSSSFMDSNACGLFSANVLWGTEGPLCFL